MGKPIEKKSHGKTIIMHLKRHHKKYLFGAIGGFAIVKLALLFFGLSPVLNIGNIFADNNLPELTSTLNGCTKIIESGSEESGYIYNIFCTGQNIGSIASGAFSGLNINILDLSYNKLSTFDFEVFTGISGLNNLYLDYNQIYETKNENFLSENGLNSPTLTHNCLSSEENGSSYDPNQQDVCFYVDYNPNSLTSGDVRAEIVFTGSIKKIQENLDEIPGNIKDHIVTITSNTKHSFYVTHYYNKSGIIRNYPEIGEDDGSGNTVWKFQSEVTWIDKEYPECGSIWASGARPSDEWITTHPLRFTLLEPHDSGVAGMLPDNWYCDIDEEGEQITCDVTIKDKALNTTGCTTSPVNLDWTAPSIVLSGENYYVSNNRGVDVLISDEVAGLSERQHLRFRWQTDTDCTSTNIGYYDAKALQNEEVAKTWTTTILSTGGLIDNGEYYLCIMPGSIVDRAGNASAGLISDVTFIIDNTAPNCVRSAPSTNSLQIGRTGYIVLSCTDNGAGVQTMQLDTDAIVFSNDGILEISSITTGEIESGIEYTFVYEAINTGSTTITLVENMIIDNVLNGNTIGAPSSTITVTTNSHGSSDCDNGPLVQFESQPNSNWAVSDNFKIRWHCESTGGWRYASGTSASGSENEPENDYYTFENDNYEGSITDQSQNYNYVCAFGKTGERIQTICSDNQIRIDKTDPTITVAQIGNIEYGSNLILSWTGSDTPSGISGYILKIYEPNGGVVEHNFNSGTNSTRMTINQSGLWFWSIEAYDYVGNYTGVTSGFNIIDPGTPTPPTPGTETGILIQFKNPPYSGWTNNLTIEFELAEGATGEWTYSSNNNTGSFSCNSDCQSIPSTQTLQFTGAINGQYICAIAHKGGDNQTICSDNKIFVDSYPPQIEGNKPISGTHFEFGDSVTFEWSGHDEGPSGVSGYILTIMDSDDTVYGTYTFNSGTTQTGINVKKSGTLTWNVKIDDLAGNRAEDSGYFYVHRNGDSDTGFYLISPRLFEEIELGTDITFRWNTGTTDTEYKWNVKKLGGDTISGGTTSGNNIVLDDQYFSVGSYSRSVRDMTGKVTKEIPLFYVIKSGESPDLKVNQFEFNEIDDADANEYYTSNRITINGLDDDWYTYAYLKDNIGALYINGIFVGTEGVVKNGDKIRIELKAQTGFNSTITAKLIVGTGSNLVSGDFKVTTINGITGRDESSLSTMQKLWGVIYIDSLVEMYQYDEEKLATFLSTFMQILKDKSDYYAQKIAEAEADGDDELATKYKTYKNAIDFLYTIVKYRYDNIDVEDRTVYIAPNGKEYIVEYDEDRRAYTSPDFTRPKYFPSWELFTNHIDMNNPAIGKWGIVGNVITTHNGKVYTIYETNGKWTSSNFNTAKYFDTKEDIINHILANNPASDWNHTIDTEFDEVKYTAPNGKVYKIFKTSSKGNNPNMYSSYNFVNAKYFTSLEAAKKFIDQNNKK